MSDPSSHTPGALPRRYDIYLGVTAALCVAAIIAFMIAQCFPDLRVSGDARFAVVLWLIEIGGVSTVCFVLRPHIAHIHYAMEIGLHRGGTYIALADDHPRQLVARRAAWCAAGTAALCCWGVAAVTDAAVGSDMLDLQGSNLDVTTMLTCSAGSISCLVRVLGPDLAELDRVYRAARDHAARLQGLIPAQRTAGQPERHRAGF